MMGMGRAADGNVATEPGLRSSAVDVAGAGGQFARIFLLSADDLDSVGAHPALRAPCEAFADLRQRFGLITQQLMAGLAAPGQPVVAADFPGIQLAALRPQAVCFTHGVAGVPAAAYAVLLERGLPPDGVTPPRFGYALGLKWVAADQLQVSRKLMETMRKARRSLVCRQGVAWGGAAEPVVNVLDDDLVQTGMATVSAFTKQMLDAVRTQLPLRGGTPAGQWVP